MKHIYTTSLLLIALILSPFSGQSQRTNTNTPQFAEGIITIKLKVDVGEYDTQSGMVYFGIPSLDALVEEYGINSLKRTFSVPKDIEEKSAIGLSRIYTLSFEGESSLRSVIKAFSNDQNIEYAEAVPIISFFSVPNDANYDLCYYLPQVMAEEAWDIHKGEDGTEEVVIAIVDSGTKWDHEDLIDNVWQNLGEDADGDGHTIEFINDEWVLDPGDLNGEDDDGNEYDDDLIGFDINMSNLIGDGSNPDAAPGGLPKHGTWCAGVAAASTNNLIGIASLSYNLKYMPVAIGSYDIDIFNNGYAGIVYAATNAADIISCSWGTLSETLAGLDAVAFAEEQGSIVVAGAGNNQLEYYNFPASYPGVISVANVDADDEKYWTSSYNCAVDISAPGVGINSTSYDTTTFIDEYSNVTGTSFSGPLVAAALGLLKSYHPDWTNDQLIERLLVSTDYIYDLNPDYLYKLGSGRLNAFQMLNGDTTESANIKLGLRKVHVLDENENDIAEAGETAGINLDIRNFSQLYGAENATFTLSSTDPDISIVAGEMTADIIVDSVINLHDVFEISIADDAEYHFAELQLQTDSDVDVVKGAVITFSIVIEAGGCFVYDGIEDGADFSGEYIRDYLENNGYEVRYETGDQYPPSFAGFEAVFLSFGNFESGSRTFTNAMASTLEDYLDWGGDVYIEGADHFGYDQINNYSLFNMFGLDDVLDATTENNPISELNGLSGSLAENMVFTDNTQDENAWIDVYTPSSEGVAAFDEEGYGIVGIQYDAGTYQTFSFAYAISKLTDEESPSTRDDLLAEILEFFNHTTGINEVDEDPFSCTVFPNPSQNGSTIRYHLSQPSTLTIRIMNSHGQLLEERVNQMQTQGQHEFYWNAEELPAGVYYYTLMSENNKSNGKIMLMK